jgi:antitoxin component YwqK of YwqJK toxin-antitoxin module
MKVISIAILVLACMNSHAQEGTIYFDKDWNESSSNKAHFYRIYSYNSDSTVSVKDYYKKGDRLQMTGTFTDTSFSTKIGYFEYFHKNGNILYRRTFNSKGNRQGIRQIFHRSGKKCCELTYKDGIKEGPNNYYYRNGQLKWTINYQNNLLSGWRTIYRRNGSIRKEVEYEEDYKTGNYSKYSRNGNRSKKVTLEY